MIISFDFPNDITLPSLRIYDSSQTLRVSLTLWSVMRTPILELVNDFIIFCISITDIGSIPANGSSSRRNFGSMDKALAISTLLLSPPDRLAPLLSSIF